MMAAFAGCVSQPADQTGAPQQGAPVVPYSKGPSAPPYVKGPTAPPPDAEVSASQQSVTETVNVKYELPESTTVETVR
jgi:hypothetical protein